ncbi:MAG: hypothetical protein [Caudoviricetes sp.]|nr:MAG: hypothetical protein [Caudoviricetes sp.]
MQIRGIDLDIGRKYTWGSGHFEYEVRVHSERAIEVYCHQTGLCLSPPTALMHLMALDSIEDLRYVEETADAAKRDRPLSPY